MTTATTTPTVSKLMYDFSEIRDIVKDHETTFNLDLTEKEKARKKIVAFKSPELIDTRNSADKKFPSTKMKNPVTAAAIKDFLNFNKKFICQESISDKPEFVHDGSNTKTAYVAEDLADLRDSFDADIIEFDDKFGSLGLKSTLVFSIIVNRSSKQIILVFRGTFGTTKLSQLKNLLVDFRFFQHRPKILNKITNRNVKLHRGFSDYLLNDNVDETDQLQQIINILKEVYEYETETRCYKDYELVVTGHSLGGALAQLCSYMLAGLPEMDFIPKPIKAVTFASPVVGNKEFFKSYQDLEKAGKIRHLRVSNNKDWIPGDPPFFKEFVQTGVNIHLRPCEAAEVKYENTKTVLSQFNPFGPTKAHKITPDEDHGYHTRLYAKGKKSGEFINNHILDKSIEEIYEEYAEL
mmetsp:Transcript_9456/g.10172  ORF Transcript_9456/g.10172 Transcript_9456/m.10172 type:complete len:408 (+) Transcript_9456:196-1419(+)